MVQTLLPDSRGSTVGHLHFDRCSYCREENELNEENNNPEQRTLKDLATDARVITEGTWSNVFDAQTCLDDADEDPGGVPNENSPFAWIEDVELDIYRHPLVLEKFQSSKLLKKKTYRPWT